MGLILHCLVPNPAIGGNRAIFDEYLMSGTISNLNHRVSAREMLFFIVLYEHFFEMGSFVAIFKVSKITHISRNFLA